MATYFVDDATGSDLDDGLTEGNAFATVTHALDSGAGTHTFAAGDITMDVPPSQYIKAQL